MKKTWGMLPCAAALLAIAAPADAQDQEYPRAEDVATAEAAVLAAYDALSRAPGESSEWERFRSLHLPSALLIPNTEQRGGEMAPLSVDGFIDWIDGITEQSAPIGSPQDQGFGAGPHGEAALRRRRANHRTRCAPTDRTGSSGINAFTLVHDGDRWWIASVAWDEENAAGPIPAQYLDARSSARPSDVESIDAVINASYATLQRAPGEPFQWERYRSLRLPGALLVPNSEQSGGQFAPRTVEEHIAMVDAWYAENMPVGSPQDQGFAEEEIHREVHRYGDVAHVESTYVKRFHDSEEILGRGINFYTLVFDGERWWISAAAWDEENGAGEIPAKYLP